MIIKLRAFIPPGLALLKEQMPATFFNFFGILFIFILLAVAYPYIVLFFFCYDRRIGSNPSQVGHLAASVSIWVEFEKMIPVVIKLVLLFKASLSVLRNLKKFPLWF